MRNETDHMRNETDASVLGDNVREILRELGTDTFRVGTRPAMYIQDVTGGTDQTSGGRSLC